MIASAARTLRLCIMAFSNHCHPPRIRTAMNRAARGGDEVPVRARRHRFPCTRRALTRTDRPGHSGSHLPWLTPQTDLVPDKGQFRSRFHHPLNYGCPATIFLDPRNRHRHHLSATLLDGRAGNGCARWLRCGRDRSGGEFPSAGYEPASVMRRLSLSRSEPRPKYPEKSLPDNNT